MNKYKKGDWVILDTGEYAQIEKVKLETGENIWIEDITTVFAGYFYKVGGLDSYYHENMLSPGDERPEQTSDLPDFVNNFFELADVFVQKYKEYNQEKEL